MLGDNTQALPFLFWDKYFSMERRQRSRRSNLLQKFPSLSVYYYRRRWHGELVFLAEPTRQDDIA